jgi:hypothetical protein
MKSRAGWLFVDLNLFLFLFFSFFFFLFAFFQDLTKSRWCFSWLNPADFLVTFDN